MVGMPLAIDETMVKGAEQLKPPMDRRAWMATLSRATREEMETAAEGLAPLAAYRLVRGPETGLVMVRGRTGGGGAPFNLGEVTVTRATVSVPSEGEPGGGLVGHGFVLGTDRRRAELAALFDALLQDPLIGQRVEERLIVPVERRLAAEAERAAEETAATKVDFFTLVRGED